GRFGARHREVGRRSLGSALAGGTAGTAGLGGGSARRREAAADAVWNGELRADVLPPSCRQTVRVPGGRSHRGDTPPAGQRRCQSAAGRAGRGAIVSQERTMGPEEAWHVSAQTVMAALRQTSVPDWRKAPATKRRVKYLFVEANEDHVPSQQGGRWQPRLVYVHEGWRERQDGRRELIRPHYFGELDDPHELWATVWRYLEGHYDLE